MDDSNIKHHGRDTHAMPPQAICNMYKNYQKLDDAAVDEDFNVVDFRHGLTASQKERIVPVDMVSSELINSARKAFQSSTKEFGNMKETDIIPEACTIFEHKDFPGLRLYPSLLPPECQMLMVSSLLHRDLSNPLHKTNIHQDYDMPYPPPIAGTPDHKSYFSFPPASKNEIFTPLNPHSNFKPLYMTQFLSKKLRWLTLGSQYDWTTRAYPATSPTPFPSDIGALVTTLFQNSFTPESGVVLLYSPKDYMPVHRDVSEECERGLASFTLGCDGLFIISRDKAPKEGEKIDETNEDREMEMCVLRVRSGDCVWMGGETRWCWHAMPKVMAGTCPEWLHDWPVGSGGSDKDEKVYERWRGFMKAKRVNISCRQVWG